jgi:Rne/Rng family ribonuclease
MTKSIIVSERDNIAAVVDNGKVSEFFINRGDILLGDIYLATVENVLPSIDAAFVNVGGDKMGFLHASDVSGKGALKDRISPKQQILVQAIKEPTGNKGPRVTTSISLPGRFLVFMPDEKGVNVSKKISSAKERNRLKSIVNLIKPAGVGVIIRTEAENQADSEIQEDLELLLEKWSNIVTAADTVTPPNLLYRDQDLLYRVIREACNEEVNEIVVDTPFALHRTNQLLQNWNLGKNITASVYKGPDNILVAKGIDREIRTALQSKVNLPSGGYLYVQTTEALSVIDVNSGKFTSSATQNETIRQTNLEAVFEIARQLKLRNIGGMIIIDFIDMENRIDKLTILEALENALEPDKSKPQVGQLSDLGLVELTRHRQGQSLAEIFTKKCPACHGLGAIIEEFNFASSPIDPEANKFKPQKVKFPQKAGKPIQNEMNNNMGIQKPRVMNGEVVQNIERQHQARHVIKTNPNLAAAAQSKLMRPEKQDMEINDINDEVIARMFNTKDLNAGTSKTVHLTEVPPTIAGELMNENFTPNVFTVLREMESADKPQTAVTKEVKPQQTVSPSPVKHFHPNQRPHQNNPINKFKGGNQPERKNLADEVNKIHMMNQLKLNEKEKSETETTKPINPEKTDVIENTQIIQILPTTPTPRQPAQSVNVPKQVKRPLAKPIHAKHLPVKLAETSKQEEAPKKPETVTASPAVVQETPVTEIKRRGRKPKAPPIKPE